MLFIIQIIIQDLPHIVLGHFRNHFFSLHIQIYKLSNYSSSKAEDYLLLVKFSILQSYIKQNLSSATGDFHTASPITCLLICFPIPLVSIWEIFHCTDYQNFSTLCKRVSSCNNRTVICRLEFLSISLYLITS